MALPPSENEPRDDHDQHNLQQQTDDRGEARHATEKAVPEQQAKQTCAEKVSSKPAEQARRRTSQDGLQAGRRARRCRVA